MKVLRDATVFGQVELEVGAEVVSVFSFRPPGSDWSDIRVGYLADPDEMCKEVRKFNLIFPGAVIDPCGYRLIGVVIQESVTRIGVPGMPGYQEQVFRIPVHVFEEEIPRPVSGRLAKVLEAPPV